MTNSVTGERDFEDLVREGIALLPVHAPQWTDHNPSDPGVTLIELLAYLSDILLYRTGRITPAAKLQFLRLLRGAAWQDWVRLDIADADELQRSIDAAVSELAHVQCAVTAGDFEQLALAAAQRQAPPGQRYATHCVMNANLSGGGRRGVDLQSPGHVSVVIAALDEISADDAAKLRARVRRYLLPKCLLTTRLHVISPDYLYIGIGFRVALRPGVSLQATTQQIGAALQERFETGGAPPDMASLFGATLHLAEVARIIDDVPGVDYVEDVTVLQLSTMRHAAMHVDASVGVQVGRRSTLGVDTRIGGVALDEERLVRDSEGVLASVRLKPWELLRLAIAHDGVEPIAAAKFDEAARRGGRDG
jgi:hypothetical protein